MEYIPDNLVMHEREEYEQLQQRKKTKRLKHLSDLYALVEREGFIDERIDG